MSAEEKDEREATEYLAELGLAFFSAQALEFSLVSLFAATRLRRAGPSAVPLLRSLMDERMSQTLGRLIRIATTELNLAANLGEALEGALETRNWLVHRFYFEFGPAAFSTKMRRRGLQRIRTARRQFESVGDAVHAEVRRRVLAAGVSPTELEAGIKQTTDQYIADYLATP